MSDIRSGWFRPNSDFHGGTRAPEAHIRVTFNVKTRNAAGLRDSLAAIPNASDANVIGYGFFEGQYTSIDPKDILFACTEETRHGTRTDANMEVFSAFNGEIIPPKIEQEDFNRMYRAVGVSQGQSDPDFKHGGDKSGIAGISQGATTITNNSEHTFYFGDMVRAVPPYIDAAKRQHFHSSLEAETHENYIAGKHKGRLEHVSYEGIVGQIHEAVAILTEDTGSLEIPARFAQLLANSLPDESDARGVALNLKRFINWAIFQTLLYSRANPAAFSSDVLELAAQLGLVASATTRENISMQKDLLPRIFVSSLNSASSSEKAMLAIARQLPSATVTTPFMSSAIPQQTLASEQLQRTGECAFDLLWRSQAHLLERQGSSVFGQCLGTSEPGQPMDINVHAT